MKAHNVSKNFKIDIVTDTIDKLIHNNKSLLRVKVLRN